MVGLIFAHQKSVAVLKCNRSNSAFIVAWTAHSVMLGSSNITLSGRSHLDEFFFRIGISSAPPERRMPRRKTV